MPVLENRSPNLCIFCPTWDYNILRPLCLQTPVIYFLIKRKETKFHGHTKLATLMYHSVCLNLKRYRKQARRYPSPFK
jgi:hypothetical protein